MNKAIQTGPGCTKSSYICHSRLIPHSCAKEKDFWPMTAQEGQHPPHSAVSWVKPGDGWTPGQSNTFPYLYQGHKLNFHEGGWGWRGSIGLIHPSNTPKTVIPCLCWYMSTCPFQRPALLLSSYGIFWLLLCLNQSRLEVAQTSAFFFPPFSFFSLPFKQHVANMQPGVKSSQGNKKNQ